MPQNKYALARYCLIDSLFRQFEYVKTTLIVEHCRKNLGYQVSQRTIQMDIEALRDDPFLGYFAPVEYCKKRKAYYYSHTNFELTPLSISKKELEVLLYLYEYLNGQIVKEYYSIFTDYVNKIKKYQVHKQ